MTLALYGKSRRRQGVLVMLALFAVFAAMIGGVAATQQQDARAATSGTLEGNTPTAGTPACTNPGNAASANNSRADCTNGQALEMSVPTDSVPAHATDIAFTVYIEGQVQNDNNTDRFAVAVMSTSVNATGATSVNSDLFENESGDGDSTFEVPSGGACSTFGSTWTYADLAGLKVRLTATTDDTLRVDDVDVRICWAFRQITSATVGGGSAVALAPSGTTNLVVNVTTGTESGMDSAANDWACTTYQVETLGLLPQNHGNTTSSGNQSQNWNITAPAAAGTYDVTMTAYSDDACTLRASNTFTLVDAIVVKTQRDVKVQKVAQVDTHLAANFVATVGGTPVNLALAQGALTSTVSAAVSLPVNTASSVTETTNAPSWTLVGYNHQPINGTCPSAAGSYSAALTTLPANATDYLVCIMNNPPAKTQRTISVQKVAASTAHNGGSFTITVTNTQPAVDTSHPIAQTLASGAASATPGSVVLPVNSVGNIDETATASGWTSDDYVLLVNNTGTAVCPAGNDGAYGGSSINYPANQNDYLACVRNTPPDLTADCVAGDVDACIDLLIAHTGPQINPPNSCSGIDANFIIDKSGSIEAPELVLLKSGITSFASLLAGGSNFSGSTFSDDNQQITAGYVSAATFNTAVNLITSGGRTWTEGGIQEGMANTVNDSVKPNMMFIVTDGGPNSTAANQTLSLTDEMTWVNSANEAITAANAARAAGFVVRAVYAGDPDANMPWSDPNDDIAFANAVLSRLGGGSFLSGSWDTIASNLLVSAGCDPNVLKSSGTPVDTTPGGPMDHAEWTITLVNPSTAGPVSITATDAGATLIAPFPGAGVCTNGDTNLADGLTCSVPAKVGGTNGTVVLTARTAIPAYNVCAGTSGTNTVTISGTNITGSANGTFTIAAQPNDPSCLGTLKVYKEEGGYLANASSSQNWSFSLSGGQSAPGPIVIANAGNNSWTGLAPGTYTVTETNGSGLTACAGTGFLTTHGIATNPATVGTVHGSLVVTAGATTEVYFKNAGCPGTVAIAKSSAPADTVPAGGVATWTVTVTVAGNPTTSAWTISDDMPTGFVISGGITPSAGITCGAPAAAPNQDFTCTLAANSAVGSYTITIPVIAPAANVPANCKLYTNSATISGGTGSTISGPATASDDLTVNQCVIPKVTLSKTNSTANNTVLGGGTFNWILTAVVEDGPTASALTITDNLPLGMVLNGTITDAAGPGGDATKMSCTPSDSDSFTCTLLTAAPNGTYTITVPVLAPTASTLAVCKAYNNSATASFSGAGIVAGSPATNSVSVLCPDVTIAKTAGASPIDAGASTTFTITVTNAGPGTAHNVVVSDTLSNKADWSESLAECSISGTAYLNEVLSCTFPTIAPGNQVIVVSASTRNPDSCGLIPNQATVTAANETNPNNNSSSTVNVTVNCPDASVVKSAGQTSVDAGENVTYTVTVSASANGASANVNLSDQLQAGMEWTISGANSADCTPPLVKPNGGVLACAFGNMAAGTSKTITLSAKTTRDQCPTGVANTASITSTVDVQPNNNSSTPPNVTVNCPNLSITKTADAATVNAGEQIGFTVTVSNAGPGTANGFALNDPLPAGGKDWSIQSQSGPVTCTVTGALGAETLKCPGTGTVDLAPTGGTPISVKVISLTDKTSCGVVSNTATVTANNHATLTANASTTVNCPNIEVTKLATNGTLSAGDLAEFTITVKNTGVGAATNVTVTDNPLPGNLPWAIASVTPNTPSCAITPTGVPANPSRLDCTFATLASNAQIAIKVSALSAAANCGTLVNNVTVGAANEPTNLVNSLNSGQATIAVNCAQIAILKTPDASPVNATDGIGYTITASNTGAGIARGVVVTDSLPNTPPGLSWSITPAVAGCGINTAPNPDVLTCNFGDLDPVGGANASKSVHISSPTTKDTCGTVANTASVTTSNDGSGNSPSNIVVNCPNVTVAKTLPQGQAATVSAGDNISYQIVVSVLGNGTAYSVVANDTLPANTSGWSITTNPGGACGLVGLQLTCNFGNVAAPSSFTIVLAGKAIGANGAVTCGPLVNTATAGATNETAGADNSDPETISVNCPAISVVKTATNSPISAGDQAQFKIVVSNAAGGGTATNVVVSDSLPTNLNWTENHANCSVTGVAPAQQTLSCSGGAFASMAPGASIEILVSATTTKANCTVLTNYARATSSNDQLPGDQYVESQLATITVNCPDLHVVKTASNGTINAGDNAVYTITVINGDNAGTGTAKDVVLKDNLPQGATLVWTENQNVACDIVAGALTCNIGSMLPDSAFHVTVTAPTTAAVCGTLTNQALAQASNADDELSTMVDIVVQCADVKITKSADPNSVSAGTNAVFSIEVENLGPGVARDVKFTDTLPVGFSWTSVPGGPTCTESLGVLTCSFGDMAFGDTESVTLTAPTNADQCELITNTAIATSQFEKSDQLANNTSTATIDVLCPDLLVEKVAEDSLVQYGEAVSFTITVTNIGKGVAKGVVVTDDLPDGIGWESTPGATTCSIAAGVLTCNYDEILPGPENAKTIVISSLEASPPATCEPIVNSVFASATNETPPVVIIGDSVFDVQEVIAVPTILLNNSAEATVDVECGSITITKIDQLSANNPNRPAGGWDFRITRDGQPFDTETIVGSGSVTLENLPFGSYAVTEDQAIVGICPQPNPTATFRTEGPGAAQVVNGDNLSRTFTITNSECGVVLSTGTLEIHKVEDVNANHIQDPGEVKLAGWLMTITGPQFPGGTTIPTDANGRIILPGIETGVYTVTEGAQTGYQAVGVVVDDNAPVFSVANTGSTALEFSDTDIITFYNQPRGSISVKKNAVTSHNGGGDVPALDDDDGWVITLKSVSCGINTQLVTDASGAATFPNLPLCGDYEVSENPVNAGSPGFVVVGSAKVSSVTPGRVTPAQVTFTNRRATQDPPCTTCSQIPTPTPTPTTPPATPTNTPVVTATPAAPTATNTVPISTVVGERTAGPGSPTPIAPSTGEGVFGGAVGGANLLLVLIGLVSVAGGLFVVATGRRRN